MQNDTWTSEWPTEPGNYWFHSYKHHWKPETSLVKVRLQCGVLFFLYDGSLIHEDEGFKGLWLPAEVPEPSEFNVE